MKTIALVNPKLLVINGGDGTVQAALTELYNGGHFDLDDPPPVAVLPSGKTNLIAIELGARGDPIAALEKLIELARSDLKPHVVERELIALRRGADEQRPVIGMFLGGAGLAETMLYCRDRIYPLGLPNAISHALTAIAAFAKMALGIRAAFLPSDPKPLSVSLSEKESQLTGRFSLLVVTTLDKLLLSAELAGRQQGRLRLLAVEEKPMTMLRGLIATIGGKVGRTPVRGVHFEEAREINIEGDSSEVILDGEIFRAEPGRPINLRTAAPLSFVRLAA